MKKLLTVSLFLSIVIGLSTNESFAGRGGGGQGRGGQGGNGQNGSMQQQMMQYRYRGMPGGSGMRNGMMQQQCLRNGTCSGQSGSARQGSGSKRGRMQGRQRSGSGGRNITSTTGGPLSQQETENILLMREEEKLARDVYLALGEKWNVPVFANIARSESRHMAAIQGLVQRYDLKDPIADTTPGVFSSPKFARLYDELVAAGSVSATEAYAVGVQIEELDIADLRDALKTTTHSDIQSVYQNLLRASQSHLRAFSSQRYDPTRSRLIQTAPHAE